MEYLLFTYPNCDKCEGFKAYLRQTGFQGVEYNLTQKDSKLKVREYLDHIRRDEYGAMVLPIFVLREKESLLGVFNTPLEVEGWLKSRA
jgi:glutaredoxin